MTVVVHNGRRIVYYGNNVVRAVDIANKINPRYEVQIGDNMSSFALRALYQ